MTATDTMDAGEQELVRGSLRHMLDGVDAAAAPSALLAQGWADLVATEPTVALTTLAEEAGGMASPAPIVDLAMLWSLGHADRSDLAVVLPAPGSVGLPPGTAVDGGIVVDGFVWAGADRADHLVVGTADGPLVIPADSLEATPVGGFDPKLGLARIAGRFDPSTAESLGDAGAWDGAVTAGRRSMGSQMVGAARQMLADTSRYVLERHQYGRSIGSFQTVKHRLSDVHVAISVAQAAVAAAWNTDTALSGAAAKALAGRAQQLASKHCQQVQGGIAFTVEHGFHDWVRRGHILDATLGNADDLTRLVGRTILAERHVPRVEVLPE